MFGFGKSHGKFCNLIMKNVQVPLLWFNYKSKISIRINHLNLFCNFYDVSIAQDYLRVKVYQILNLILLTA